MSRKKTFYCPRCRHRDEETVPSRLRCPRCGSAIPRPDPGCILDMGIRTRPLSRV
jgi:hypothetical protein